jgi:GH15 family glucan-1,4-alpha-glucosidase
VLDCFTIGDAAGAQRRILRVIEGQRGSMEFEIRIAPRFDYGEVRPWIRRHGYRLHSAIGGNDALVVWCDQELEEAPEHELAARTTVAAGERVRLSLSYCPPEVIDARGPEEPDGEALDRRLEDTVAWWREWAQALRLSGRDELGARRSGIALKALTYAPTGAIVAAPTTSLPETIGGQRNWDYRYAWIRDSSFSSRAFVELGAVREADAFRAFIMRSAAGHADELQIVYGVGGERRLGASMGSDPDLSVVNSDHRAWEVPNLFVADGSVMPTQGSANPAITIMALASRLAERLARGRVGERASRSRPRRALRPALSRPGDA